MAKNITEFAPGFKGSQTNVEEREVIFRPFRSADANGNEHACRGTHNYGSGTFVFTCDKDITVTDLWIQGGSGNSGGSCCCSASEPNSSGAYIRTRNEPWTAESIWCFAMHGGGCCREAAAGQEGCCVLWTDADRNYCIQVRGGHCACGDCGLPTSTVCGINAFSTKYSQYSWQGWTYSCKKGDRDEYIRCKNCHEQDGSREFPFDSDVTMFKADYGFFSTGCCTAAGAGWCGVAQWFPIPGGNKVTGRRYGVAIANSINEHGGTSTMCLNRAWGSMPAFTDICLAGAGGPGANNNSSSCNRGGPGHSATVVIKWKEV